MTALTLLDLPATFDTVDNDIVLLCLEYWFDLSGHTLRWLVCVLSHAQLIPIKIPINIQLLHPLSLVVVSYKVLYN